MKIKKKVVKKEKVVIEMSLEEAETLSDAMREDFDDTHYDAVVNFQKQLEVCVDDSMD